MESLDHLHLSGEAYLGLILITMPRHPQSLHQTLQTQEALSAKMGLLLPVVVGSITAATLLLGITILIVKKKKSQLKYDTEKAEGNSDESQKLKSEEKFTSK